MFLQMWLLIVISTLVAGESPSNITKFTANYLSISPTIHRGDDVRFICQTSGNPLSSVSLVMKNTGKVLSEAYCGTTLDFTKVDLDCQDQGKYVCQVNDSVGTREEITVNVIGKVLFSKSSNNNYKVYKSHPQASLNLPMSACPSPETVSLLYYDGHSFIRYPWTSFAYTFPSTSYIKVEIQYFDTVAVDRITKFILSAGNSFGEKAYVNFTIEYIDNTVPATNSVPSNITSFTANSESNTLTVNRGEDVRFICQTSGNSLASVSLVKKNTDKVLSKAYYGTTIDFTKVDLDCQDEGIYVCQVNDGVGTSKEITVHVIGNVQFLKSSYNNYRVYKSYPHAYLEFPMSACPSPKNVSLLYFDGHMFLPYRWSEFAYTFSSTSYLRVEIRNLDRVASVDMPTKFILSAGDSVNEKAYFPFTLEYIDDTPPATSTEDESTGTSGLGVGAVFGIVLGAMIVMGVAFGISYYLFCSSRSRLRMHRPEQRSSAHQPFYITGAPVSAPATAAGLPGGDRDSYQTSLPPPSYESLTLSDVNINNTTSNSSLELTSGDRDKPESPPPTYASVQLYQLRPQPPPYEYPEEATNGRSV